MNLRDQIREISDRRINPNFTSATSFPQQVDTLAGKAFAFEWEKIEEAEKDCRAIRRAYILLHNVGWVTAEEPACE